MLPTTNPAGMPNGRVQNLAQACGQERGIGRRFWFGHLQDMTLAGVLSELIWRIAGIEEQVALFSE